MSSLERLLASTLVLIGLAIGGWLGVRHYGAERYQAGHDAAVAAGKVQHDRDAATTYQTESDLRARLAAADADAHRKEQEYASNLEAAQRRVRAGVDSLRCPAASPVPASAASGDRPTAAGPATDTAGPAMVPDDSATLLSLVADHQRLVQRYARVVERFEACRAVNAQP